MTIKIWEVFAMLLIHWIADFVLQTDWQAKNKSINATALLSHVIIYSSVWLIPLWIYIGLPKAIAFCFLTFIFHGLVDNETSNINTNLWKKGKTHLFFVSVGFDQLLHFVQLIITYKLLTVT